MQKSNSDEWGTPVSLFIGACIEFNITPYLNVNGIAVLAARTDTKAWHQYILGQTNCEVIFIQGRVKYLTADNKPSINPSPFPSALVVWRKFD